MSQTQSIGTDITQQILDRMATDQPLPQQQREIDQAPAADRENATSLAVLISSAVAEARAQYQKGGKRGLVLCDQMGPLQVWYVPQKQWAQAVTRVPKQAQEDINGCTNDLFLVVHYIWAKGQKHGKNTIYSSPQQNSPTDRSCTGYQSDAGGLRSGY